MEALARRFDLWNKLRKPPCLDLRQDEKRGFAPEVIVGPLNYTLCSGGGCLCQAFGTHSKYREQVLSSTRVEGIRFRREHACCCEIAMTKVQIREILPTSIPQRRSPSLS